MLTKYVSIIKCVVILLSIHILHFKCLFNLKCKCSCHVVFIQNESAMILMKFGKIVNAVTIQLLVSYIYLLIYDTLQYIIIAFIF